MGEFGSRRHLPHRHLTGSVTTGTKLAVLSGTRPARASQ
jgi:hypothetical protein